MDWLNPEFELIFYAIIVLLISNYYLNFFLKESLTYYRIGPVP